MKYNQYQRTKKYSIKQNDRLKALVFCFFQRTTKSLDGRGLLISTLNPNPKIPDKSVETIKQLLFLILK
jgi:hypothetical protein